MAFQLRPRRQFRNRRAKKSMSLDLIPSCSFNTPDLVVTLQTTVSLKGIPQYQLDTGELPTSAAKTGANEVTLTYTAPGAAVEVTIPQNDPGIRNSTGGYVTPGTFPC